jgi:hypothetical protein
MKPVIGARSGGYDELYNELYNDRTGNDRRRL